MAGTATTSSSIAEWIRPGPIWTDAAKYVKTLDGAKDTLEGFINIVDWMAHLGFEKEFAETASHDLEPIKQTLAIPGFIESLGTMKDKWSVWNNSDDLDAFTDLTTSVAVSTLKFSESAMVVDSWGIYALKDWMRAAKTGFWASAGLIDGINFCREISKAENLQKDVEGIHSPEKKNVWQHKIYLCYLNVIKATTTIAMATIALISLFFASVAHGFLFSPGVFLTLTSAWLILTYATHFYGKMIDRWEQKVPIGNI